MQNTMIRPLTQTLSKQHRSIFPLARNQPIRSIRSQSRNIVSIPHRPTATSRYDLRSPLCRHIPVGTGREHIRYQSNSVGELIPSTLSQEEYERISEEDMETLSENLGALCEEPGNEKWEVDYSSGVLTLSIPPHGTYVLNKQPPNQQIWISSPVSGPGRFGYVSPPSSSSTDTEGIRGTWTHFRREGVTLGGMIEGELRILGVGKELAEDWTGVGMK